MTEAGDRAALRRRANAIRWRARALRQAADELDELAAELDSIAKPATEPSGDSHPGGA